MFGLDPDLDGVSEAEDDEAEDEEHGDAGHHGGHERPVVCDEPLPDLSLSLGDGEDGSVTDLPLVLHHKHVGLHGVVGDTTDLLTVHDSRAEHFDPSSKSVEKLTITGP